LRALFNEELVESRLWRRKENAVRFIEDAFLRSEDADELVDPVVIRRYVVITDRPIIAQAIDIFSFEIIGTKSKRYTSPVVGASADHTGAEPIELRTVLVGIRFAFEFPSAICRIEVAKVTMRRA